MSGGWLAAVISGSGHPTMKSRTGAAKSVRGEIPLLRGGEPPDVVTRWRGGSTKLAAQGSAQPALGSGSARKARPE